MTSMMWFSFFRVDILMRLPDQQNEQKNVPSSNFTMENQPI